MAKAIEIKNFSYQYPDHTDALTDINLVIDHGEKVALIGPNGAGKSTLLLVMSVFLKGKGQVTIDGIEANSKNAKKIRKSLASVLQNPDEQLFMPRLFDDVAFGPMNMNLDTEQIKLRTNEALKTVGLIDKADKPPHYLSSASNQYGFF